MVKVLDNKVRGIRVKMPSGYILGRTEKGVGKAQMLNGTALRSIIGPGVIKALAGTALTVQDEGNVTSAQVNTLNFVGTGVTEAGGSNVATITVPGLISKDEGSTLVDPTLSINYVGAGVTATNVGGNVSVTIPGGISTTLTQNHILVGNTTDVATDVAVSGDATIVASGSITLANSGVTAGTYGDATNVAQITVDAKGRITAASNVGITIGTSTALSAAILALTPTAYWKLDETSSTFADSSGNGFTLTGSGNFDYSFSSLLAADSTPYVRPRASSGKLTRAGALGITVPITGNWSIIAVIRPDTVAVRNMIFSIEGTADGDANNNAQVRLFGSTASRMAVGWETATGTDQDTSSGGGASLRLEEINIIGAVKDATAKTVQFFRNGHLEAGTTAGTAYTNEVTGGATGNLTVSVGFGTKAGSTNANTVIGHVAFFNGTTLTAAQMFGIAQAAGLTGH